MSRFHQLIILNKSTLMRHTLKILAPSGEFHVIVKLVSNMEENIMPAGEGTEIK